MEINKEILKINKEILEKTFKEADSKTRDVLVSLFPYLAKYDAVNVEDSLVIGSDTSTKNLFFVGIGMAPSLLENKCFIVNHKYNLEVPEYKGRQIFYFVLKD